MCTPHLGRSDELACMKSRTREHHAFHLFFLTLKEIPALSFDLNFQFYYTHSHLIEADAHIYNICMHTEPYMIARAHTLSLGENGLNHEIGEFKFHLI